MAIYNRDSARRSNYSRQLSLRSLKRRIRRFFQMLALTFYVVLLILLFIIFIICFQFVNNHPKPSTPTPVHNKTIFFQPLVGYLDYEDPSPHWEDHVQFKPPEVEAERIDWHDYATMAADRKRVGPGEQGHEVLNTNGNLKETEQQLIEEYGLNALVSDLISVNRSVPGFNMPNCLKKRYLAKLPTVSIVIVSRNEYTSVFKRTLHSIVNRTPETLLKEIIIVDDNSKRDTIIQELSEYANLNFPNLVQFISLREPKPRNYAKVAGAQIATGDVLVFLDSHVECNHNWLPPLLEPIAINERIITCPIRDVISESKFVYITNEYIHRGGFDWTLTYHSLPKNLYAEADPTKPYKNPIMMNGPFAISRQVFWDLGGFEMSREFWGAEQFDLSFKTWMCGGMLLAVPCSRIGHIFKGNTQTDAEDKRDKYALLMHNKRIAHVWLDEYKKHFYDLLPESYKYIYGGNINAQHDLRKRLKCKSFKWFLTTVAPDILEANPIDSETDFANGALQSFAYPNVCLDNMNELEGRVGVFGCATDYEQPHSNQFWRLNKYQELRNHWRNLCLDAFESKPNAEVMMFECHHQGGNQFWYYDIALKWLMHSSSRRCLEIIYKDDQFMIVVNPCDEENDQMKWIFGFVNETLTPRMYDEQQSDVAILQFGN